MKFGFREIIFVALMLALLAGTYVFVFSKTTAKREAMQKDIADWDKMLNDFRTSTAGIEDMNAKIDELSNAIKFFEQKLPEEKDVGDILQQVWDMAKTNSLQSKTVKPDKAEVGPNYSELPMQLEKLPRITRITQMKLEKNKDRDGEATAQLTLSIFFEPQRDGVATAN
jgi:Tfp pilus assembly protein PilO